MSKILYKSLSYLLVFIFFFCSTISISKNKVLVMTSVVGRPDFIEVQYKTLKKFLKEDFKYVVFNDAKLYDRRKAIESKCKALDVPIVQLPEDKILCPSPNPKQSRFHYVSWRHGHIIRYMMDKLGFDHDGIVMLIDSDMFLMRDFSVSKFLDGYDIAGLPQYPQNDIMYLWMGLIFFKMNSLANKKSMYFLPDKIDGYWCDSGAQLYYYFKKNPDVKIRFFHQKGRFFLDKDLNPYYLLTPPIHYKRYYLKCAKCCYNQKEKCSHSDAILKELNFSKNIIKYVYQKEFPFDCEFVLNDIFFHYRRGSNYFDTSCLRLKRKNQLFRKFFSALLNEGILVESGNRLKS